MSSQSRKMEDVTLEHIKEIEETLEQVTSQASSEALKALGEVFDRGAKRVRELLTSSVITVLAKAITPEPIAEWEKPENSEVLEDEE